MTRRFVKHVGALWRHKHAKVGDYFSGVLDLGGLGEVPIAIFKNDRKEKGKKQPDYRIVLSQQNGETRERSSEPDSGATGAAEQMPY